MFSKKDEKDEEVNPIFTYFVYVVPITVLIVATLIYTLVLSLDKHFHVICILSFGVLLITSLSYIYYLSAVTTPNIKWPPVLSKCPDNWMIKDNKCVGPVNPVDYSAIPKTYNLNNMSYNCNDGEHDIMFSSICDKQQFAQKCGVYWSGITDENIKC
jgi:hypothetical protein